MIYSGSKTGRSRILLLAVIVTSSDRVVWAQMEKTDALFIGGRIDRVSVRDSEIKEGGGGGNLEWVHPISERSSLSLGITSDSMAGSRWTFGKVGSNVNLSRKTSVYGELNLGAGRETAGVFTYQDYRLGTSRALIEKRLLAEIEVQHVAISTVKGNLIKVGGTASPKSWLSLHAHYQVSTSGNVRANLILQRTDISYRRVNFLSGFAVGRTPPELLGVINSNGESDGRTREYFVGFTFPAGVQGPVTILFDTIAAPYFDRTAILLNWRVPLRYPWR